MNFRPNGLLITMITFQIFGRARNHGKKVPKLCQTSFSGMVHFCYYVSFERRNCRKYSLVSLFKLSFHKANFDRRGGGALECNLTGRCLFFKSLDNPFRKNNCILIPCFGIFRLQNNRETIAYCY